MTGNRRGSGSDLQKVDARDPDATDFDDIPELGQEWFDKARPHVGGKPAKRGRPRSASPKQLLTLRIDPQVIDAFRSTGPGWQARMAEVLRVAAGALKAAA